VRLKGRCSIVKVMLLFLRVFVCRTNRLIRSPRRQALKQCRQRIRIRHLTKIDFALTEIHSKKIKIPEATFF
jgi:hypothetical protein